MTTHYASFGGTGDGSSPASTGDLTSLIGSAISGDTILCMDGNYGDVTIQGKTLAIAAYTIPADETVPGFPDGHPARKVRGVVFTTLYLGATNATHTADAAPNCTFTNIKFAWDGWVDTQMQEQFTSAPQGIVHISYLADAPVFTGCEFSWGYGPTQIPFVPGNDYPEYESGTWATSTHNAAGRGDMPQTWWVAAPAMTSPTNLDVGTDTRAYNTIAAAPRAVVMVAYGPQKPPHFVACHFHDLSAGLEVSWNGGLFVLDQCWFERIYQDCVTSGTGTSSPTDPNNKMFDGAGMHVTRNIFEHPMCHNTDSFNPHGDVIQHFNGVPVLSGKAPLIQNLQLERNFIVIRNGDRGSWQIFFLEGAVQHDFVNFECQYTSILARDNLAIERGTAEGLAATFVRDGLFDRNMFVPIPMDANPSNGTTYFLVQDTYDTSDSGGFPRVTNSITELPGFGASPPVAADHNLAIGSNYTSTPLATLLQGPWPPASDDAASWFASAQRNAGYASYGPKYTTLSDLVLQPLTKDDIVVWTASSTATGQVKASTATSRANPIQGPGDSVTVSVDIGQFRIEDPFGTVITPWRSTPLTGVPCDANHCLRLNHTTAKRPTTVTVQNATLTHPTQGAKTAMFRSITADTVALPGVLLDNAPAKLSYTGALSSTDTNRLTIACVFTPTQVVSSSSHILFGNSVGYAPIKLRVLPSGQMRIILLPWHTANWDSAQTVVPGDTYMLIMSVDSATGAACQAWNLSNPGASVTWNALAAGDLTNSAMTLSTSTTYLINSASGGPAPILDYFYLDTTSYVDPTDPTVMAKFAKGAMGPNGQGPTGSIPAVFLAGNAADYGVSGGLNLGGATAKFVVASGTVKDADHTYPPTLEIYVDPVSAAPYPVNTAIPLTVTVGGYSKAFNLTGHSNFSGTWSATPLAVPAGFAGGTISFTPTVTGTHTLTFTNDVGYIGPASISLKVT